MGSGGVVLGNSVGFGEGGEGLRVRVHQFQETEPKGLGALHKAADVLLDVGISLLADGELSHHVAEGDADGSGKSAGAAAARDGRGRGELLGKCSNCLVN